MKAWIINIELVHIYGRVFDFRELLSVRHCVKLFEDKSKTNEIQILTFKQLMNLNFNAEEKANKIPWECREGRNEKLVLMEGITVRFVKITAHELYLKDWQDLNAGNWSGEGSRSLDSDYDFQGTV